MAEDVHRGGHQFSCRSVTDKRFCIVKNAINPDRHSREMLRQAKVAALGLLRGVGCFELVASSRWRQQRLLILCYHGIALDDEDKWRPRLYMVVPARVRSAYGDMPDPGKYSDSVGDIIHSESEFRLQMELIARHYRPVSLDDLIGALQNGRELAKRSVVITFDDGYTDNSKNAMPILNCLGVPATFYITVECVERRTLPWPSRLRYAFRNTNQSTWTDTRSKVWMLDNPRDRQEAFLTACDECCQLTGQIQEDFVQRLQQELESCLPSQLADLMYSGSLSFNSRRRSSDCNCVSASAIRYATRRLSPGVSSRTVATA